MSNAMFYQLADELCAIMDSESIDIGAVRITKTRNDGVVITYDKALVYMGIVSGIDYDILRRLLALHKRVAELDETMVIAVRTMVSELTDVTYGTYYLPCDAAMYGMGAAFVAESIDAIDELLVSGAEPLAYSQHKEEQADTVTEASEDMVVYSSPHTGMFDTEKIADMLYRRHGADDDAAEQTEKGEG